MNPISPIDTYASGPIVGLGLSPQQPTSATSGGGISSTPATQLSGLSQINQAVSQMLEGVGGGLENNQMVRALIGMIVLLALIEQLLGGGQDQGQNELARLGNGLGGGPGGSSESAGLYFSSNSVSIEYTSTTIIASSGYADSPSADPSGQAIDEAG